MKRNVIVSILIALFALAPLAHVFADEPVPLVPAQSLGSAATPAEVKAIADGVSQEVKSLRGELIGKKGAVPALKNDVSSLAGSMREMAKNQKDLVGAVNASTDRINQFVDYVNTEFKNVSNQIVANFLLICILVIAGFVCLGIMIFFGISRKKNKPVTVDDLTKRDATLVLNLTDIKDSVMKAVQDSQVKVQKTVTTTADETVKRIKEQVRGPFTFTFTRLKQKATLKDFYNERGFRTMHIPEGTTYSEDIDEILDSLDYESDRNNAHESIHRTLKGVLGGEITVNGSGWDRMTIRLLNHLKDTTHDLTVESI
jgi:hypothetical protein